MTLLSPRYILVHSFEATINIADPSPFAHCFGPFDNLDALLAFEDDKGEDTCYRFAIPLVGPEQRDLTITMIGRTLGARPATVGLPHREGGSERDDEQRRLIDKAIRKASKKARKEAKRLREQQDET